MDVNLDFSGELIKMVNEANKGISHDDFVAGVNEGSIGFKMIDGEPSKFLFGPRKTLFNIFVFLYLVAPFIVVPIFAYSSKNWWLLLGILVSEIFTHFTTWRRAEFGGKWKSKLINLFLVAFVINWFINGFHFYNYITFFFICALWGTITFLIADESQYDYALQILKENKKLFDLAIDQQQIMIIKKRKIESEKQDEDRYSQASILSEKGMKKFENGDYASALSDFSRAIELYPLNTVYGKRAEVKTKLQDFEGAILDYTAAIKMMPDIPNKLLFASFYRKRAELNKKLGLHNEAQLDTLEAEKLEGNLPNSTS